ncbi:hypothetical protein D2L64_04235 [Micromonospora radicis]|uniref:Uncharacterized protein n=1 Tax=Micromonospora radicis TaxID=1894971 RepID=A0A418N0F1_9ACTN|nr:hypothetical protein D2L64_04235 [Micromonospora radicis]
MRARRFRCPRTVLPSLPRRRRGASLPDWMRQPTQALPLEDLRRDAPNSLGRAGWLTRAQQWRANGGRS